LLSLLIPLSYFPPSLDLPVQSPLQSWLFTFPLPPPKPSGDQPMAFLVPGILVRVAYSGKRFPILQMFFPFPVNTIFFGLFPLACYLSIFRTRLGIGFLTWRSSQNNHPFSLPCPLSPTPSAPLFFDDMFSFFSIGSHLSFFQPFM